MADRNELILANMILSRVEQQPDVPVVTFEWQGSYEVRTYRQLWENAQRLAKGLRQSGLKEGEYFAILLENHPEFVELMIASTIVGTVFVPIDARTRGARLAHMLKDSGAKGIVCNAADWPGLRDVVEQTQAIEWVAALDAKPEGVTHVVAEWLSAPLPEPQIEVAPQDPSKPMELMYTSGTTGDPKGIIIPLARFGNSAGHGETVFGYREDERPYTGLSLTHGNGQFVTLAPSLKMGLNCVISRKFTKSRLWDIMRANGCTTFSLLGGMATGIYSEPPRADDAENPVRMVVSAGMPSALWDKFETRFGTRIIEFYAAMEGGMSIKRIGEGPVGSCGRVAPGLVAKLVDEEGNEVGPGVPGEVCFQTEDGAFPPVKYLNNPEASANKVVDGWLRSGDIMIRDADGWLFFQFRKGGGLRRNGDFVNPAAVERVLAEHELVDDVFVYGVQAANGAPGERDVVAAIVARKGLVAAQLFAWVSQRLEPNMVPTYIQIVDEIPKTASEKPQERFLVEQFNTDKSGIFTVEGEIA